jgi:hypothetical protein
MFEKASRLRLRFNTARGKVSVEDLWDMPLASRDNFNLDAAAIDVNNELKSKSESFVEPKNAVESELALKLDILKYIIAVKLKEMKAREDALAKKARKEYILSVIREKQNDELKGKSIEELERELGEL